jgi:transcriptional antiterminator NusG
MEIEDFEERPGATTDTALAAASDEHEAAEQVLDAAVNDEAAAEVLDAAADAAAVEAVVADAAATDALERAADELALAEAFREAAAEEATAGEPEEAAADEAIAEELEVLAEQDVVEAVIDEIVAEEAAVEAVEDATVAEVLHEAAEEEAVEAVLLEVDAEERVVEAQVAIVEAEIADVAVEEAAAAEAEAEPGPSAIRGPGDWYVVHTYSGYENKVKANLHQRIASMQMEDKIFDVHIPMEDVMEIKAGKKQVVQRKVFPGYLLVRMIYDNDSWYVVRNTPGVTGFVSSGTGTKPTPLSQREVEKIMAVKKQDEKPAVRLEWEEGDVVRIVAGPFADFTGTISEINVEQSKLRVMVNIFDRETPVELAFDQVAKA